ncbi:MAG: LlaJI family restriction endonuclease [Bacteroides sp.]|nr:LlaJI family restriction endonuclease [Bacteroides sp.]
MFLLKNIHSGYDRINWTRTLTRSQMVVQHDTPVYLNPVNKKRMVNFDEELLVIFYSILNHIHQEFGFPVEINVNYDLITGRKFRQYMDGLGIRRLRQIKYKYFSDRALELWDLCFAFFEQSKQIRMASQMNEFLLAKNFNMVFEAIIDELIGDHTFPDRLNKVQEDGKEVDHLFLWDSLTRVRRDDEERKGDRMTYYIGDSKYYKQKNSIGPKSVAKQFTYARNVIQWNLNLFFGEDGQRDERHETDFCLRDKVTEGYNVIPNFFISGTVPEDLNYKDNIEATRRTARTFVSRQYVNRLFDRDTLLVTHYDVNFLFVLSLYARDNAMQKKSWRDKVRDIFRDKIREELSHRYRFHAMRAFPGINSRKWIKEHFADIIGKVFAPYENDKGIIALALVKPESVPDPEERKKVEAENADVLALLKTAFDCVELKSLKEDPRSLLPPPRISAVKLPEIEKEGIFMVMMENYDKKFPRFSSAGKIAVPIKYTESGMELLENAAKIGAVLFHTRKKDGQHLFGLTEPVRFIPRDKVPSDYYMTNKNPSRPDSDEPVVFLYALMKFTASGELDSSALDSCLKGYGPKSERYDPQYAELRDLVEDLPDRQEGVDG